VPAGLALYWFMSNLSGVVFQYFYMGRQIEWRSMLTLGPAAAPAAKARAPRPGEQQRAKPAGKPEGAGERPEVEGEGGRAGQPGGPEARRKRHGRRRGKR
jgi:creatinine amidohydrolase/Fe(II)-dependent formamide hydrolase-like protein